MPAASSPSIAVREMNATPGRGATFTDSCSPAPARLQAAEPQAGAPQLLLDDLPHAGPFLHDDERLRARSSTENSRPAAGWPGGTARTISSRASGSNTSERFLQAPTMPSSTSRPATRSITAWVSQMEATRRTGCSRWNSQSSSGTRCAPGPVEAPRARVPQLAVVESRDVLEQLLLELEDPLRAPVEAPPASVGSTRRPERSSSFCEPLLEARTCRLTAGWVTPSRSAWEKLSRSTTPRRTSRAVAYP